MTLILVTEFALFASKLIFQVVLIVRALFGVGRNALNVLNLLTSCNVWHVLAMGLLIILVLLAIKLIQLFANRLALGIVF